MVDNSQCPALRKIALSGRISRLIPTIRTANVEWTWKNLWDSAQVTRKMKGVCIFASFQAKQVVQEFVKKDWINCPCLLPWTLLQKIYRRLYFSVGLRRSSEDSLSEDSPEKWKRSAIEFIDWISKGEWENSLVVRRTSFAHFDFACLFRFQISLCGNMSNISRRRGIRLVIWRNI
jgi:hypothetical protein